MCLPDAIDFPLLHTNQVAIDEDKGNNVNILYLLALERMCSAISPSNNSPGLHDRVAATMDMDKTSAEIYKIASELRPRSEAIITDAEWDQSVQSTVGSPHP